jgi:hypothetical protein
MDPIAKKPINRRDFLKVGAVGGLAVSGLSRLSAAPQNPGPGTGPFTELCSQPIRTVRVGFVGVGFMGKNHVRNYLSIPGVEIRAVCDMVPEKVDLVSDWVVKAGFPRPKAYTRGERDFERMCAEEDLDLVMTATPWQWHTPICLAAMQNGKHAATEVPAALTVEDCWKLVEASEKYKKHCVMMENCCYDRPEMMVLNMVRQGVFGELLHAECGYLHDLRNLKLSDYYQDQWRVRFSMSHNANLYPTHGLGPVAQCMNINRGNRFDYLVSMSSNPRGLALYAREHLGSDHPLAKADYKLGDLNVTLIRTIQGQTIYLSHDTNLPRPYSRIFLVQGTRAIHQGYPERIHIEGRSPAHKWEPLEQYQAEYDHPLWKNLGTQGAEAAHGGMDWLEDHRLISCLQQGRPMDMDVYDAASWSCIVGVTGDSVAQRSRPVDIPDFTRGAWEKRSPLAIIGA